MSNALKANINDLQNILSMFIQPGKPQVITPYLVGWPGIGKSEAVEKFCKDKGLDLIDMRLSQNLETDLIGILREESHESAFCTWKAPVNLPWSNNPAFNKKSGVLFLDELNQAPEEVIKACFQLIYNHQVGSNKLADNWYIICAGNIGAEDGNDGLTEFSSALKDRLAIIEIDRHSCTKSWFGYAKNKGLPQQIISFLETSPEYLYYETKNEGDTVFITPRRWDKFGQLFNQQSDISMKDFTTNVGPFMLYGLAPTFLKYLKDNEMITAEDILYNWKKVEKKVMEKCEKSEDEILSLSNNIIDWIANNLEKGKLGWQLPKETKAVRDNLFAFVSLLRDDHIFNFVKTLSDKAGVRCYDFYNLRFGDEHKEFFTEKVINNVPKEDRPPEDFNLKDVFKKVYEHKDEIETTALAELEKRLDKKLTPADVEALIKEHFGEIKI